MTVRPVVSSGDLRAFIDLPYRLHAGDPHWVPRLKFEIKGLLDRSKNPFFQHAEAEYFLALRGARVVGRIAAIANHLHNQTHGDKVGFFGWFECERDHEAAGALFDVAAQWLRDRGFDTIRGPASFSVNEECGLLVEGFDTTATLMSPHNPPYYGELLEQAGFSKAKDLWMYHHGDPTGLRVEPLPERLARGVELIRKRYGVTIRPLDMSDFPAEVDRVKSLYNQAWEKNWGFVPMTDQEIDHMAKEFKPVVMSDLVPFVEKDGQPVAFALAMPDLNQVFGPNRSGRLFPTVLRLLWWLKRRKFHRMRIMLLGTLPEYRNKGLDAVLYAWLWSKGLENGMRWGEAGWILEDNPGMNAGLIKMGFTHYKTYRLYDRPL